MSPVQCEIMATQNIRTAHVLPRTNGENKSKPSEISSTELSSMRVPSSNIEIESNVTELSTRDSITDTCSIYNDSDASFYEEPVNETNIYHYFDQKIKTFHLPFADNIVSDIARTCYNFHEICSIKCIRF